MCRSKPFSLLKQRLEIFELGFEFLGNFLFLLDFFFCEFSGFLSICNIRRWRIFSAFTVVCRGCFQILNLGYSKRSLETSRCKEGVSKAKTRWQPIIGSGKTMSFCLVLLGQFLGWGVNWFP